MLTGKPKAIHRYYGPEYISGALITWTRNQGIRLEYNQPGKPQQHAYVEHYNRTVRYDCFNQYLLESIAEVQDAAVLLPATLVASAIWSSLTSA